MSLYFPIFNEKYCYHQNVFGTILLEIQHASVLDD